MYPSLKISKAGHVDLTAHTTPNKSDVARVERNDTRRSARYFNDATSLAIRLRLLIVFDAGSITILQSLDISRRAPGVAALYPGYEKAGFG